MITVLRMISTGLAASTILWVAAPALAQVDVGDVLRFGAPLDGAQSVALNSTALETRNGTGSAEVTFNPVTLDLAYDISFQGLIAEDITLGGTEFLNFDPTRPTGDLPQLNGLFGVSLVHFHVGARGVNGPIPVDIISSGGMRAFGVTTTVPDNLLTATQGRVSGRLNLRDLDRMTPPDAPVEDGVLMNGVTIDQLVDAFAANNVYLNIHTFNNLFGEIRGQIVPICSSTSTSTADLRAVVAALDVANGVRRFLNNELDEIDASIARGAARRARLQLADLVEDVTRLSTSSGSGRRAGRRIGVAAANDLSCGITNVLTALGGPVQADDPGDDDPGDAMMDMMMEDQNDEMMMDQ